MPYRNNLDVQIIPQKPLDTNSTFFTECCEVAICDYESRCPKCNRKVVGHDAKTDHDRHLRRSRSSTRYWPRI